MSDEVLSTGLLRGVGWEAAQVMLKEAERRIVPASGMLFCRWRAGPCSSCRDFWGRSTGPIHPRRHSAYC